ncbi:MAG: hypothetical protein SNJ70_05455 [Armatimonadota bacterium]
MQNIDIKDIEQFYNSKLDVSRMLEIDEAIQNDSNVKALAMSYLASRKEVGELMEGIINVYECPEYEMLSAYVDDTLGSDDKKSITAHINMCEYCYNGVQRIKDIRAQAQLREPIQVEIAKQSKKYPQWGFWKRFALGSALLILAVVIGFDAVINDPNNNQQPTSTVEVAEAPLETNEPETKVEEPKPEQPTVIAQEPTPAQETIADNTDEPKSIQTTNIPKIVFEDGKYAVRKDNNKYIITKKDSANKVSINSKIMAAINEKIATGKISPVSAAQLAVISQSLRDGNNANISPIAPKPISPIGVVVIQSTPEISWSEVDLADSYKLVITDSTGREVYSKITTKNSDVVSEKLRRGEVYTWRVGVRFGETHSWDYSEAAKFQVLSDEGYNNVISIKKQMPNSHLALGVVYEMYGLKNEAKAEYSKLILRDGKAKQYIK